MAVDSEQHETPSDVDVATETARRIAGEDAAAAYVHLLTCETRTLVHGPLCRRLIPQVADLLDRTTVAPGEAVRRIVESTPRTAEALATLAHHKEEH